MGSPVTPKIDNSDSEDSIKKANPNDAIAYKKNIAVGSPVNL